MLKLGCAEQILEVPLFAELYGYGPYADRRNKGVLSPLYCRAFTFFDGKQRAMVIYSDVCTTCDEYAREMRAKLASAYHLNPEGIAFVATHTHSAPALSSEYGSSSGIAHPQFQKNWKEAVMRVARAALANEEAITDIYAGKAPLDRPIGTNRVHKEENPTDPAIRWIRFCRADGTCKVLLHNHGVHGIACSGSMYRYASPDWMGSANRIIKERGLAEMPLFMLGPAGNINTRSTCLSAKNDNEHDILGEEYVNYLQRDLKNGTKLDIGDISFILKTLEFPTVKKSIAQLQEEAAEFRTLGTTQQQKDYWEINARRLEEMCLMLERGDDLSVWHDLQAIRIGGIEMMFVPGEPYVQLGLEILQKAKCQFPILATVSNGNGEYFFTEDTAKHYPTPSSKNNGPIFGFYEIYVYMHIHHFKYVDDIGAFLVKNMLEL